MDGRTDRQTDRNELLLSLSHVSVLTRDKNISMTADKINKHADHIVIKIDRNKAVT